MSLTKDELVQVLIHEVAILPKDLARLISTYGWDSSVRWESCVKGLNISSCGQLLKAWHRTGPLVALMRHSDDASFTLRIWGNGCASLGMVPRDISPHKKINCASEWTCGGTSPIEDYKHSKWRYGLNDCLIDVKIQTSTCFRNSLTLKFRKKHCGAEYMKSGNAKDCVGKKIVMKGFPRGYVFGITSHYKGNFAIVNPDNYDKGGTPRIDKQTKRPFCMSWS